MRLLLVLAVLGLASAFVPRNMLKARSGLVRVEMSESTTAEGGSPRFEDRNDVYVGNMPFDLEEGELTNMISDALGSDLESSSIRIIRDRDTGRSRGFGYISFDSKEEAEESVEKLQGLSAAGREFRVNVSVPKDQRPPREARPPREQGPSVFIGNLDFSVENDEVVSLCDSVLGEGFVTRVRIAIDRNTGRSRGFGHLDFATEEDAATALEKLAGTELAGRQLRVDVAQRREDRPPRQRRENQHSVFIGNLSWDIDTNFVEDMLDDILGPGSFEAVRLATDNQTGRIRGFGHVDFKDSDTAARAVVELNGMEVLGRQLRVDHAEKKY